MPERTFSEITTSAAAGDPRPPAREDPHWRRHDGAFPPIADVATFLRACKKAGVAFKATAGLHHPLRCVKPLTYAPDAPTGTMHGFLNVFLAAALLDHADEILREEHPDAFAFDDDGASWRGHRVSTELARDEPRLRDVVGSCSFEEPIGDLRALVGCRATQIIRRIGVEHAFSRCGVDRVSRGDHGGDVGAPIRMGPGRAGDEVYFDHRRFGDAQQRRISVARLFGAQS